MHEIAVRLLLLASPLTGPQGLTDDDRQALAAAALIVDDVWKAQSNELHARLAAYTHAATLGLSLAEVRRQECGG